VSSASSRTFEDVKVGVRCKIAALWIAMLFLFAYGDIFGFFSPGQLQEVMAGEISGMAITQGFLFAVSLYVAIASVMVSSRWSSARPLTAGPTSSCRACTSSPSWRRRSANVGVLLVLERHRERPAVADRLVRLDMAQPAGNP
jgi:hypothetical protein